MAKPRAIASICCSPPDRVPAVRCMNRPSCGKRRDRLLLHPLHVAAAVGHHPEVLAHREVREDAAALGDEAQPEAGEVLGSRPVHPPPGHHDVARWSRRAGRRRRAASSTSRRRSVRAARRRDPGARRGPRRAAPRRRRSRRGARAARGSARPRSRGSAPRSRGRLLAGAQVRVEHRLIVLHGVRLALGDHPARG